MLFISVRFSIKSRALIFLIINRVSREYYSKSNVNPINKCNIICGQDVKIKVIRAKDNLRWDFFFEKLISRLSEKISRFEHNAQSTRIAQIVSKCS